MVFVNAMMLIVIVILGLSRIWSSRSSIVVRCAVIFVYTVSLDLCLYCWSCYCYCWYLCWIL